jgi:hypothetical protein
MQFAAFQRHFRERDADEGRPRLPVNGAGLGLLALCSRARRRKFIRPARVSSSSRAWPGSRATPGPRVCENPALQPAFNQFHYNIHHALPLEGTNGPQNGAPGLHNFKGADLIGRRC